MTKKLEIIQLSVQFIKKASFKDLSYDYLAKQLAITKTAIHYYFKNKKDLGLAICNYLETGLQERFNYFMEHSDETAWEFIHRRHQTLSQDDICPIVSLQTDLNEYEEEMQQAIIHLVAKEYQVYREILARNMPITSAEALAQIHLSSIKGAQIYNRTLNIPFSETILKKIKQEIGEAENT